MSDSGEEWDEFNLLVVGETGAGKSTLVNALANYFAFDNFEEALRYEPIVLISTKFTETIDGEEMDFKAKGLFEGGKHTENTTTGQSATQFPHSYVFPFPKKMRIIRVIDSPGFSDTRGLLQDKMNIRYLIDYLHNFDKLHGILIFMKANEARTTAFKYCIDELLLHLPRLAERNILFGFTSSSAQNFTPGEGEPPLSRYLKDHDEKNGIRIQFSESNYFCFDNAAFLAQCVYMTNKDMFAKLYGDDTRMATCFHRSKESAEALFKKVRHLDPIDTTELTELLELRSNLNALCAPRAEIRKKKKTNSQAQTVLGPVLKSNDQKLQEENERLLVEKEKYERVELGYNRVVCYGPKCTVTATNEDGHSVSIYRVCHDECQCYESNAIAINDVNVQKCSIMKEEKVVEVKTSTATTSATKSSPAGKVAEKTNIVCAKCGCSWMIHMKINFEMRKKTYFVEDEKVRRRIDVLEHEIAEDRAQITALHAEETELDLELGKISEVSRLVAARVKRSALLFVNDGMLLMLEHAINEESRLGRNSAKLEELQRMKAEHNEQVLLFADTSATRTATPEDANKIALAIESIRQMKHSGSAFNNCATYQKLIYDELEIDVPLSEKRSEVERDRLRQREEAELQEALAKSRASQEHDEKVRRLEQKRADAQQQHEEKMALLRRRIQLLQEPQSDSDSLSSDDDS